MSDPSETTYSELAERVQRGKNVVRRMSDDELNRYRISALTTLLLNMLTEYFGMDAARAYIADAQERRDTNPAAAYMLDNLMLAETQFPVALTALETAAVMVDEYRERSGLPIFRDPEP